MKISKKTEGFLLAMNDVGVSNTPTFLYKRLRRHPIVTFLAGSATIDELKADLQEIREAKPRDSLEKATIAFLYLFAVYKKFGDGQFDESTRALINSLDLPWIDELLRLREAEIFAPKTDIFSFTIKPRSDSAASYVGATDEVKNLLITAH